MWFTKKLRNDIHVSLSFLMLYTALNTQSHIQKTLTDSIQKDNPDYSVDGYTCFGILYFTYAFTSWLTPCIFAALGSDAARMIGFLCNIPFAFACYSEVATFTYASAVIGGFGLALCWVAQSNYIVLNSEVGNVYASISCFWLFYKISFLLGDAIVFFEFSDADHPINYDLRVRVTEILLCFILIAITLIGLLEPPARAEDVRDRASCSFLTKIKVAYSIFSCRNLIILSIIYTYIGVNFSHMSVTGVSMGFSKYLSANSKKFAPLSGVLQGVGEILGTLLSMYLKNRKCCKGKIIFVIGCISNMTAYLLVLLALPNDSSFTYTHTLPIMQLPILFLFLANILVGLGDASIQIEMFHCVGTLYPNDSIPAFGVLYFFSGLGEATCYFYSAAVGLHCQLITLLLLSSVTLFMYYSSQALMLKSDEREELILYASEIPQYTSEQTKCDIVDTPEPGPSTADNDFGTDNLFIGHL